MALRMGLLGQKVGMTQAFDEKGTWTPQCVIETGPCLVLDIKTVERDGYSALQLGFGEKSERLTKRPNAGLFQKANTSPKRFVREIRLPDGEIEKFKIGQSLSVGQIFRPGDVVDVIGTSKGKGFQGVMKRHHFRGFRATHGTHEYFRHGGSIGCRLTPGRVMKGKLMPGQLGNRRVTVQNIRVISVLDDKNLLVLEGGVPGAPGGFLIIRQAAKRAYRPVNLEAQKPVEADSSEASEAAE